MKNLKILASALVLLSAAAQAWNCRQVMDPRARYEYILSVRISEDQRSAALYRESGDGQSLLDNYRCKNAPTPKPGNGGINPTYPVLTCSNPKSPDGGKFFTLAHQPVMNRYIGILTSAAGTPQPNRVEFVCER